MPIESNAANTRVPRDVRNYRSKLDADQHARDEVRSQVRGRGAAVPGTGPASELKPRSVYEVFAQWQHPTNKKRPERLGGGLNETIPPHLGDKLPKPVAGTNFEWVPPHSGQQDKIQVEVRADGAVVHKNPDGTEREGVHHYMHAVFDDILYIARGHLETINLALEAYADNPSPNTAAAYRAAVLAFEDFVASLQPGGSSPYSGAFNSAGIAPVVTNEGFIVSCRVKLNWKNPYHSSSTIKIP